MGSDRVLGAAEVGVALAAHGFGSERPPSGAVVLALGDPLRVVWANARAAEVFGTADPAGIFEQAFAGRGRDGLAAAMRRLVQGGGPKAERLRLFRGFRTRTLSVSISRTELADGEDVYVLAIPVPDTEPADAGSFAVSALRSPRRPESQEEIVVAPLPAPPIPQPPASAPAGVLLPLPSWLTALGQKRFVWQTDAAGRLKALASAPPALLGLADQGLLGSSLVDAVARLGADPGGLLAAAFATRRSFSGIRLSWPVPGGTVPVTVGAVPNRGGTDGYKGFGLADFSAAEARPEAASDIPGPSATEDEPASGLFSPMLDEPDAPDPTFEAPGTEAVMPDASLVRSETAVPSGETQMPFASAKVVALRPFQVVGSNVAEPATPPARRHDDPSPEPTRNASSDVANLSTAEHFNFNEIGRALKGEIDDRRPGTATTVEAGTTLLSALPVALLLVSGGRVLVANPAFLALSGYASAAALEQAGGLAHLLSGLDPAQVAGPRHDRAFPIIDAAGQVMAVEGRMGSLPWGDGVAQVLTLRPAATAEAPDRDLRRHDVEAHDIRAMLDRISEAVATLDGQGRLLMLNRAAEVLFGVAGHGAVGESIGAFLSPEAQSAALGAVLAASAAGPEAPAGSLTVAVRRPAGNSLPLTMEMRALRPGRIGVVLRDNGMLDALRRDVRRLRAELDHAVGARADFLERVSHEVRTPLNAILGFAEIILDERFGPVGNPRYKDYLTDIHAAGKHVIDFIADLSDLSKMQAGRLDLSPAAVDVNRVIGETVGEMQGQAHRDRVIVRLSLLPHLPNALVDQGALRQIMTNVLANAVAFNEPGGQVIVSTALTEAEAVAVRVRDTGVGMSDEELAAVMEPFRQISMGRPGGGNGLGLPLTRALVEANQATMSIQSRKNEGTLVEIVLRPAPAA